MADSLYVHVPFCRNICHYCDFCKEIYNRDFADAYLKTLEEDLKTKEGPFKTIYIGGGSPSSLNHEQLESLLKMLKPYRNDNTSYTIEVNPEDMDDIKIDLLVKYGINRVSIGIQTFNAKILSFLNRKHNQDMVINLVNKLKEKGIKDINGDLMFGIPNQKNEDILNDLNILTEKLDLSHISTYALLIEEHTYFKVKNIKALDDDIEADQYELICNYLKDKGYNHYEVSNFAKPCYESKHNLTYWQAKEYAAIGPGASGYEKGIRYDISLSLSKYFKGQIEKQEYPLSASDLEYEYIILNLRLNTGLSFKEFTAKFKKDFQEEYADIIAQLLKEDLIEIQKDTLRVKEEKFFVLNRVLQKF